MTDIIEPTPTYELPGAVFMALSTNRPEIIQLLIREVERGNMLTQKNQTELLRLVMDLIKDRTEDRAKLAEHAARFEEFEEMAIGIKEKSDHLGVAIRHLVRKRKEREE